MNFKIALSALILIIFSCKDSDNVLNSYNFEEVRIEEEYKALGVELKLQLLGDFVVADLLFSNSSDRPIKVPYWIILENGLDRDCFDLIDRNGNRLEYKGVLVKRAPAREADLREIVPGQTIKTRTILNRNYEIREQSLPLTVRFQMYRYFESNVARVGVDNKSINSIDKYNKAVNILNNYLLELVVERDSLLDKNQNDISDDELKRLKEVRREIRQVKSILRRKGEDYNVFEKADEINKLKSNDE